MGCGKSKHDVVSGNTTTLKKPSEAESKSGKEIETRFNIDGGSSLKKQDSKNVKNSSSNDVDGNGESKKVVETMEEEYDVEEAKAEEEILAEESSKGEEATNGISSEKSDEEAKKEEINLADGVAAEAKQETDEKNGELVNEMEAVAKTTETKVETEASSQQNHENATPVLADSETTTATKTISEEVSVPNNENQQDVAQERKAESTPEEPKTA